MQSDDELITVPVRGKPTQFVIRHTKWGRGLVACKTYKKSQIICHYQGDVISFAEYQRRYQAKISRGDFVFSYVDLENGLILDPDSHDENIGKIANAASRELGENNNAKYARSTTQMKTKIVNVVATRTIYSGNEILCAYGTKFSGQLHRLRDEVRSASRKKNPRRKRARKDEEAEEEEEDDDEQEDEGDVEEDEEEEEKDLPHRIKTPRLVDENEESDWTEDDGPLSSPPPPLPLPPPPAPKSSPPRVAPPPIQALFHVYNLRPKKDDRAQGPYRLRKKSPSRLGKVPSPISVR